jgi:3-methyladenine DNA glycosylase AlkD
MLPEIKKDIDRLADPKKALILRRFFKTGPGEYGEGDVFVGIKVPQTRELARKYKQIDLADCLELVRDKIHEVRMLGLFIMVEKYRKGAPDERTEIYNAYLKHTAYINNWDLVDLSAEKIVGPYLADKDKKILLRLAKSDLLWERRIAILSSFHFIKNKQPETTLAIADILLNDKHDLMHKAVGWMLREIGKRCGQAIEEAYLKPRYKRMPRTMLRYAIEHFPESRRKQYLAGTI